MYAKNESLLFVYGTLRRCTGHQMAKWLQDRSDWIGKGKILGRLYDLGNYPALIIDDTGKQWVMGEIVRLHSERDWKTLDEYEGIIRPEHPENLYLRKLADAALETDGLVKVWVYYYLRAVNAEQLILSGDYCKTFEGGANGSSG